MSNIGSIYKYGSDGTTLVDTIYSGCSDAVVIIDNHSMYNTAISEVIESYQPETIRDSDFKVFSDLLSITASQVSGASNIISECYNLDKMDDELVYKIMSLYDIDYPLDYDPEKLKLLAMNYGKIRKVRGIEGSIRMLLRLIDRSEADLYQSDSDSTSITKQSNGVYLIHNGRITSTDFAVYMIKKVLRSGIQFIFDNTPDYVEHNLSDTWGTSISDNIYFTNDSKFELAIKQSLQIIASDEAYKDNSVRSATAKSTVKTSYDNYSATDSYLIKDDATKKDPSALITDRIFPYESEYDY